MLTLRTGRIFLPPPATGKRDILRNKSSGSSVAGGTTLQFCEGVAVEDKHECTTALQCCDLVRFQNNERSVTSILLRGLRLSLTEQKGSLVKLYRATFFEYLLVRYLECRQIFLFLLSRPNHKVSRSNTGVYSLCSSSMAIDDTFCNWNC